MKKIKVIHEGLREAYEARPEVRAIRERRIEDWRAALEKRNTNLRFNITYVPAVNVNFPVASSRPTTQINIPTHFSLLAAYDSTPSRDNQRNAWDDYARTGRFCLLPPPMSFRPTAFGGHQSTHDLSYNNTQVTTRIAEPLLHKIPRCGKNFCRALVVAETVENLDHRITHSQNTSQEDSKIICATSGTLADVTVQVFGYATVGTGTTIGLTMLSIPTSGTAALLIPAVMTAVVQPIVSDAGTRAGNNVEGACHRFFSSIHEARVTFSQSIPSPQDTYTPNFLPVFF